MGCLELRCKARLPLPTRTSWARKQTEKVRAGYIIFKIKKRQEKVRR